MSKAGVGTFVTEDHELASGGLALFYFAIACVDNLYACSFADSSTAVVWQRIQRLDVD